MSIGSMGLEENLTLKDFFVFDTLDFMFDSLWRT